MKFSAELLIYAQAFDILYIIYFFSYAEHLGGGSMIFISGIHAVGKGYFCGLVKKELGIEAYSASDLIAKARNASFSSDKLVAEIE